MMAHDDAARSLKLAGCDEPSVFPERLEHLRAMQKLRPEDARTVGWRADLVLLLLDEGEVPPAATRLPAPPAPRHPPAIRSECQC